MLNYTEIPKKESTKLSTAIMRLNLGEFEGDKFHLAIAFIKNIDSYVCLIKKEVFTVDQFIILDKSLMESRYLMEEDEEVLKQVNRIMNLETVKINKKRKTRKRRRK